MVSQSLCGNFQGCDVGDLTFRYNLVDDSYADTASAHGANICFMTGYTRFQNVEFAYNVFKDTYEVFQAKSVVSFDSHNNTFRNTLAIVGGTNNIYDGPDDNGQNSNGDLTSTYSLWSPIQYGFVSGGGTNIQADPKFLDPNSILGADGIPFTADDGFTLQVGSPAIDSGKTLGDTTDIHGKAIVGRTDIGAYEH
jgi:hypothetical protein